MTKSSDLSNSVNDDSISGDRLIDNSVPASKIIGGTGGDSASITYSASFTGSSERTVQNRLNEYVSVLDFGPTANTVTLQAALDSGAKLVIIPANVTFGINTTVNIPDGVNLRVDGRITSIGTGRLNALGSTTVYGSGRISCGYSYALQLTSGNCVVDGLTFDKAGTNHILIRPTAQIDSLRITNNRLINGVYAILRNPRDGINCFDTIISGNTIQNVSGDGIEWNIGPLDTRLKIDNNLIFDVDGTVSQGGLAIGIAGTVYTNDNDLNNYVLDVSITNNHIYGARQGIHLEEVANCKVSGNHITNITSSFGSTSVPTYAIACYAPVNLSLTDNFIYDCTNGVTIDFGVTAGQYVGSPLDCFVCNNNLSEAGSIAVNAGQHPTQLNRNTMVIKGNNVKNGSIQARGTVDWVIDSNSIRPIAGSTGFTLDFRSAGRGSAYVSNQSNTVRITNNHVIDKIGVSTVSISNLAGVSDWDGNLSVFAQNNNFSVPISGDDDYNKPISRVVYTTAAGLGGVPYGVEYPAGTLVVDSSSSARYLVTTAGSRNRASDTYSVESDVNGIIRSTNYAWTSGSHHQVGQAVTLSDGGVSLQGFVYRVFLESAQYKMQVVNADATPLNLSALGSTGTITATNTIQVVTV